MTDAQTQQTTDRQPTGNELVFLCPVCLPGVGSFETGDIVPERIDKRQSDYLHNNRMVKPLADIVREADERGLPSQQQQETEPSPSGDEPTAKPKRARKRRPLKSQV